MITQVPAKNVISWRTVVIVVTAIAIAAIGGVAVAQPVAGYELSGLQVSNLDLAVAPALLPGSVVEPVVAEVGLDPVSVVDSRVLSLVGDALVDVSVLPVLGVVR